MAYLVKADLYTHIDEEIIDQLTRNDDGKVTTAIAVALDEAKSYLGRFDIASLFNDTTPTPDDANLKDKTKDLVCWHLLKLSNANSDLELFKEAYDDAIKWLLNVAKGLVSPDGWPLKTDDENTNMAEGALVGSSSNTKRVNHF